MVLPALPRLFGVLLVFGLAAAGTAPVSATAPAAEQQARRHAGERPLLGRMSEEERIEAKQEARRGRPAPVKVEQAEAVPREEQEFLGISGKLRNGDIAPSDTIGAAGPDHVLTAVNIDFALWDKATVGDDAAPLFGPAPLESLFPSAFGMFIFDPKVVYDPYRDQYVLVFLGAKGPGFTGGAKDSRIFVVAIPSATAEAPETWCRRELQGDQVPRFGELWADYPGVGFDADRLYVSTNQFSFTDRFRYVQILALEKDQLYDCAVDQPSATVFARGDTRDPQGFKAFTIQPAVTVTETGARPAEFLLSFQDVECGGACGRRVIVWRIKEEGGTLKLRRRAIAVGLQRLAPLGTQQGGGKRCGGNADGCWDTGDLRLINAFYDADRRMLLGAHAIRKNVGGAAYVESSIRWYHVNPAPLGKASLQRKGLVGAAGRDAGWPVMGTDGAGNVFSTYSRAGAPKSEWLSAMAATIAPGATAPRVRKLRNGEARYERIAGAPERWGDYNGINRDAVAPSSVWTVNQYARKDGPAPTRIWQQVVNRLSFG